VKLSGLNSAVAQKKRVLILSKRNCDSLLIEIDDHSITGNLTAGEEFNYRGVKVFSSRDSFNTYQKYLKMMEK